MMFNENLDKMEMSVLDFIDWKEGNIFKTVSNSNVCGIEKDFCSRNLTYRHLCDLSLPNNLMILQRYNYKVTSTFEVEYDCFSNEQLQDTFMLHDITNMSKALYWFFRFIFLQIFRKKKCKTSTFFCIFRNDLRVFENYSQPASHKMNLFSFALDQLKNKLRLSIYFRSLFLVLEKK
jgi:hypothetical protein